MSSRPLRFDDLVTSVVRACPRGHPLVLRCHPMRIVAGRPEPFPTLYWLACPVVANRIARLEHQGWITRLEREIETDAEFRSVLARDHESYASERDALLSDAEKALLEAHGLRETLRARGVGGTYTLTKLKCLHLHYAHHLARGSAVGRRIDAIATIPLCEVETSPL